MNPKVRKVLCVIVAVILVLSIFLCFLYLAVTRPAYDMNFYKNQFEKNDTYSATGTSEETLMRIIKNTIDYLSGKKDSMQSQELINGEYRNVFYEDELSHMADVRVLFLGGKTIAIICLILVFLSMLFLCFNTSFLKKGFLKTILFTLIGIAAFITIIGIAIAIDFTGAFTVFHNIFFPQGNWSFPPYSFMITMLPSSLFFDVTVLIIIRLVVYLAIFITFAIILKTVLKKIEKNKLEKDNMASNNEIAEANKFIDISNTSNTIDIIDDDNKDDT